MKEILEQLDMILKEDFKNLPATINLDPSIMEVKANIKSRIMKIILMLNNLKEK